MSLVDFNGDGKITATEYEEFYRDCFLPVVKFWKVSIPYRTLMMPLINNHITKGKDAFKTLLPTSFLYQAYQTVRESKYYINSNCD